MNITITHEHGEVTATTLDVFLDANGFTEEEAGDLLAHLLFNKPWVYGGGAAAMVCVERDDTPWTIRDYLFCLFSPQGGFAL